MQALRLNQAQTVNPNEPTPQTLPSPCRLEALYLLTQNPIPKTQKPKLDPKPQNPHNDPTGGRGNPHSIPHEGGASWTIDHGGGEGGAAERVTIYIYICKHMYIYIYVYICVNMYIHNQQTDDCTYCPITFLFLLNSRSLVLAMTNTLRVVQGRGV